jgi:hypothetical protein
LLRLVDIEAGTGRESDLSNDGTNGTVVFERLEFRRKERGVEPVGVGLVLRKAECCYKDRGVGSLKG